jgi:hypothetical protein
MKLVQASTMSAEMAISCGVAATKGCEYTIVLERTVRFGTLDSKRAQHTAKCP